MGKALEITFKSVEPQEAMDLHQRWNTMWQVAPQLATSYMSKPCERCMVGSFKGEPCVVLMFSEVEPDTVLLRGFATGPNAPSNTCSRAIAVAAKALGKRVKRIITHSVSNMFDMASYKASAFQLVSEQMFGNTKVATLVRAT